ncbi:MAG: hypothetical protein LW636_08930 [Planctomycetaceae bacterium]|nr:hypothetical protein [Planctomycetaceae bacterium]
MGTQDTARPSNGKKPGTATITPTTVGKRPERFVDDEVFGVSTKGDSGKPGAGRASGDIIASGTNIRQTVTINNTVNNTTYNTYADQIYNANGWSPNGRGSSAGACHTWERYDCDDGISIAIGFGGGFSFGFFYGSSCAPLCTSWANPWWCGYASSWSCGPSWYACRPYYSWCHRPWWHDWSSCAGWYSPCPRPWWTPSYFYTPVVYTPYAYTQVVYQPVVVQAPPPLPTPSTLWGYLANGYDDDAADGFAVLAVAEPAEGVWYAAHGLALAFRGDEARGADLLRDAFVRDPAAMWRIDRDPRITRRIEALERVLSPMASGSPASVDALLVVAACQAARGDLAQSYFSATTAQAEGDRSAGTAAFVAWLRDEIRRNP